MARFECKVPWLLVLLVGLSVLVAMGAAPPGGGTPPADPAIVFVGSDRSGTNISVMNADGARRTVIFPPSGSFMFASPSWSPDGRSICFSLSGRFADGILRKGLGVLDVQIVNGTPVGANFRMLVSIPSGSGLSGTTWSPDGATIAYIFNGAICSIPAAGGDPVVLYAGVDLTGLWLAWNPDGTKIAYGSGGATAAAVKILDLASGTTSAICSLTQVNSTSQLDWVRTNSNHVVFHATAGTGKYVYTVEAVPGAAPQRIASTSWFPAWSPEDARIAYTTGSSDSIVIRNLQSGAVVSTGAKGRMSNWRRF